MELIRKIVGSRRSRALTGLLGICAAAALLGVFGTATDVSAQDSRPTLEVVDTGTWAADGVTAEISAALQATTLTMHERAAGSHATLPAAWKCADLRCHYIVLRWSNVTPNDDPNKPTPYTITLTRRAPTAGELGISETDYAFARVPTVLSLPVLDPNATEQVVPIPWAGKGMIIKITGAAGSEASFTWSDRAIPLSEDFSTRDTRSASTLVVDPNNGELPMILSVWPRAGGATDYGVQYTFRTRSSDPEQRLTRVTRIVAASQVVEDYASYNANWSQHRNKTELETLSASDFGDGGDWIAVVTALPKLLAGAEHWPQDEVSGDAVAADIADALGEGRNAVGIRVRPRLACAVASSAVSELCSEGIWKMAPEAEIGKQGKISYVRFDGDNVQEWVTSSGTAR